MNFESMMTTDDAREMDIAPPVTAVLGILAPRAVQLTKLQEEKIATERPDALNSTATAPPLLRDGRAPAPAPTFTKLSLKLESLMLKCDKATLLAKKAPPTASACAERPALDIEVAEHREKMDFETATVKLNPTESITLGGTCKPFCKRAMFCWSRATPGSVALSNT